MTEFFILALVTALLNRAFLRWNKGETAADPAAFVPYGCIATAVLVVSAAAGYVLDSWILIPLGWEFLRLVVMVLILLGLSLVAGWFAREYCPALCPRLTEEAPWLAGNCLILGVALACMGSTGSFGASVASAFGMGVAFTISGAALEAILGRMDPEDLPAAVRGAPALFLCAALLAMALMGFHGLSI